MTKFVFKELHVAVLFLYMACTSTAAHSDGECSNALPSAVCLKSGKSLLQTSSSAAHHSDERPDIIAFEEVDPEFQKDDAQQGTKENTSSQVELGRAADIEEQRQLERQNVDPELQKADPKLSTKDKKLSKVESGQASDSQERQRAREWLNSKFPSTSTLEAANYATSLLNLDSWISAGLYNSALFNGGKVLDSKLEAWSKTIHQTWKTKTLPRAIFRESQMSWKTAFPSWQYHLWTDDEMMPFMKEHYPDFADMFCMLPYKLMKVEAFRFFMLHRYGGIYADLDFMALKNFAGFLDKFPDKEVVVGQISENAATKRIPNALMVSKPRARLWEFMHGLLPVVLHTACLRNGHDKISSQHAYWKKVESRIDSLSRTLVGQNSGACDAEGITGPALLTTAIKHSAFNNQSVAVVDGVKFYPIDSSTEEGQKDRFDFHVMAPALILTELQKRFPNSVTATTWTHSWGHDRSRS